MSHPLKFLQLLVLCVFFPTVHTCRVHAATSVVAACRSAAAGISQGSTLSWFSGIAEIPDLRMLVHKNLGRNTKTTNLIIHSFTNRNKNKSIKTHFSRFLATSEEASRSRSVQERMQPSFLSLLAPFHRDLMIARARARSCSCSCSRRPDGSGTGVPL